MRQNQELGNRKGAEHERGEGSETFLEKNGFLEGFWALLRLSLILLKAFLKQRTTFLERNSFLTPSFSPNVAFTESRTANHTIPRILGLESPEFL